MPSLDEQFASFTTGNPRHHGVGTWVERELSDEEREFIIRLHGQGYAGGYIADFLKHKLGKSDATAGKVNTYFRKVDA